MNIININIWDVFPGLSSFTLMDPAQGFMRILLILLGGVLVYMGYKEKLDGFYDGCGQWSHPDHGRR
jgi:hypothetical protein